MTEKQPAEIKLNNTGKGPALPFIFIVLFSFSAWHPLSAQSGWKARGQFNLGCNIMLNKGKGQQFPGLRFSGGASINGVYRNNFIANYGLSFSCYSKTIGSNLNPLLADMQFDFTNSVSIGVCGDKELAYEKFFRTLNNGPFYNIAIQKQTAVLIGTQLILNNNHRNQFVGLFSASFKSVTLSYYNDGGPIINWFSLGDEFDRWWTGGLGVFFHTNNNYNKAEVSFDQFTGYSKLLYEMTTLLGLNVPVYANPSDSIKQESKRQDFNTSAYNIRFFPSAGIGIDVGAVGSLRANSGRAFGIQDIIHIKTKVALHPNHDITRFYVGGSYNYLQHEEF